MSPPRPRFHPVSKERWSDLTALFGPRGACGQCWCMELRLARADFERRKAARTTRSALKRLVDAGREPGLLGYLDEEPVAWVSVEPRATLARLATSRVLAPVDDAPVWSINCLFVRRDRRGAGLSVEGIRAAFAHARRRGARVVEGYPLDPRSRSAPVFAFPGLLSAFLKAGFREVARRSPTRPIVRRGR